MIRPLKKGKNYRKKSGLSVDTKINVGIIRPRSKAGKIRNTSWMQN